MVKPLKPGQARMYCDVPGVGDIGCMILLLIAVLAILGVLFLQRADILIRELGRLRHVQEARKEVKTAYPAGAEAVLREL